MALPEAWDPETAITLCSSGPLRGRAWQAHRRTYGATDHAGSLVVSGRYHRAPDLFPSAETWPALYLALAPEVCLGEVLRHIRPERLPMLNDYRLTELDINLSLVVDCRDPRRLGLNADVLWEDLDYTVPQALAAAALRRGMEGMLVASATRLGDNLIVFPTQLRPQSHVTMVASRDPQLYVQRS